MKYLKEWLKAKYPNKTINSNKDLQEFSTQDMLDFAEYYRQKQHPYKYTL